MTESVLKLRQFNPLGVNGGHHLVEFLLGGYDDPARCRYLSCFEQIPADFPEFLDGGPQIFDLVAAAGDMLADLIDNQNQRLSRTPAAKEFERAVYNLAHADCRITTALGMRPRIGGWIGHWIKSVKDCACPR